MSEKKLAYRRVIRDSQTNQLRVAFFDAATNQEITDLTGYEIVDGGTNAPIPNPPAPTPDTPTTGSNSNTNYDAAEPFNWQEFQNRPGASKGSGDIFGDIQKTFDNVKAGYTGAKKDFMDWVIGVTGNDKLFPDEPLIRRDAEGKPTNVQPLDGPNLKKIPADPNSAGSKELDAAMEGGKKGTTIVPNPNDIEVRKLPLEETFYDKLTAVSQIMAINGMNVTFELTSMAQPAKGSPFTDKDGNTYEERVGSTRHDIDPKTGKGSTADFTVLYNGNPVSPANWEHTAKLVAALSSVGFDGIGVGNSIIHAGGGTPALWGYGPKGGDSDYAKPEWTTAYNEGVKLRSYVKEQFVDRVVAARVNADKMPEFSTQFPGKAADDAFKITPSVIKKADAIRQSFGLPAVLSSGINAAASGVNTATSAITGGINDALTSAGQAIRDNADTFKNNEWALADANRSWNAGRNSMTGDAIIEELNVKGINQSTAGVAIADALTAGTNSYGGFLNAMNDFGKTAVSTVGNFAKGFLPKPEASTSPVVNANNIFTDKGYKPVSNAISPEFALTDAKRREYVIKTMLGEARGEGEAGLQAIAEVIRNRSLEKGIDPVEVVMAKNQFSPNANGLYEPDADGYKLYNKAGEIADLVFNGKIPDITNGSTFFYNPKLANPSWATDLIGQGYSDTYVGQHRFLSPNKPLKDVSTDQASGGSISKGFMTPVQPISEQAKSVAQASVGPAIKTDMSVAQKNTVNPSTGYNSDVVSSTRNTSLMNRPDTSKIDIGTPGRSTDTYTSPAQSGSKSSSYSAGESFTPTSITIKGASSTGSGLQGFMSSSVPVKPQVTTKSEPSPIVKAATTVKSTAPATTTKSSTTSAAKAGSGFMSSAALSGTTKINKGML